MMTADEQNAILTDGLFTHWTRPSGCAVLACAETRELLLLAGLTERHVDEAIRLGAVCVVRVTRDAVGRQVLVAFPPSARSLDAEKKISPTPMDPAPPAVSESPAPENEQAGAAPMARPARREFVVPMGPGLRVRLSVQLEEDGQYFLPMEPEEWMARGACDAQVWEAVAVLHRAKELRLLEVSPTSQEGGAA